MIERKLPSEMKSSTGSCTTPTSDPKRQSPIDSHDRGPPLATSGMGSPPPHQRVKLCHQGPGRAGQLVWRGEAGGLCSPAASTLNGFNTFPGWPPGTQAHHPDSAWNVSLESQVPCASFSQAGMIPPAHDSDFPGPALIFSHNHRSRLSFVPSLVRSFAHPPSSHLSSLTSKGTQGAPPSTCATPHHWSLTPYSIWGHPLPGNPGPTQTAHY